MWRRGTFGPCLWEYKLVHSPWKIIWHFLLRKIELPYDAAIPLRGLYPKEMKSLIRKDTCTMTFIAALFTIVKIWKQPRCPSTDEWIKMRFMYVMEYHSAIRKNWILPFSTWMNLKDIMLSEISQTEKDKYCMITQNEGCSAVSDSLWPYGLYSPWNFSGQNMGMGSLSLL